MNTRTTVWIVSPEPPSGPGQPYVQTEGHPTSASDLYRVHGIHETGHKGWHSCLTDQTTAAAIARVVEGPLDSIQTIRAAEAALHALLLYDRVDVVVPGFKCEIGSVVGYHRQQEIRSQLAFDLFAKVSAYDQIFATERVVLHDGVVQASTDAHSALLGVSLEGAKQSYLQRSDAQAAALSAMPLHLGVPAYFSDPRLTPFVGARGMLGEFATRVSVDWDAALGAVPDFGFSIKLPPLLAIVLDRAARRTEIPETIAALREELSPARRELHQFGGLLDGALDQRKLEERFREMRDSIEAIVPASRRPDASVILPILKLWKKAKSPLDSVINALNPEYKPNDPRILADRTVTGRTFAHLLRTDSVYAMTRHHFSESEIQAVARSAAAAL